MRRTKSVSKINSSSVVKIKQSIDKALGRKNTTSVHQINYKQAQNKNYVALRNQTERSLYSYSNTKKQTKKQFIEKRQTSMKQLADLVKFKEVIPHKISSKEHSCGFHSFRWYSNEGSSLLTGEKDKGGKKLQYFAMIDSVLTDEKNEMSNIKPQTKIIACRQNDKIHLGSNRNSVLLFSQTKNVEIIDNTKQQAVNLSDQKIDFLILTTVQCTKKPQFTKKIKQLSKYIYNYEDNNLADLELVLQILFKKTSKQQKHLYILIILTKQFMKKSIQAIIQKKTEGLNQLLPK